MKFDGRLDYESFRLGLNEPCVVTAAVAALAAEGLEPEYAIANGGLDANWLTAHGIPTVTLGCGQNNIHTVDEWLDLDHFDRGLPRGTPHRYGGRLTTRRHKEEHGMEGRVEVPMNVVTLMIQFLSASKAFISGFSSCLCVFVVRI